jgi:zinc protease
LQWAAPTQPWLFVAFRGPAYDPTQKDMPAMDLISSIYFSDSSDLYQELVLEKQSVDQLDTYFPDRKDPNLLLIYARLTDEAHGAEVEAAINATLARVRTELIDAQKVAETKSRLRYSFTSQMDSSKSIGNILASFVQFSRSPETINEVYRTYDQLTAEDIRSYANKYFTDAGRVTISLSSSPAMAGVSGKVSIDAAVAEAGELSMTAGAEVGTDDAGALDDDEYFTIAGDPVPVSIVAQQSASSPLVDVSFLIHAGAAQDPEGKKGLASLTAAMVTDGGSVMHSIQEINDAMYPIASGFNAQVDKEMTRLSGQVHKDNLDTWYGLVRNQLLRPGWQEQDFGRVKTQLNNAVRTDLVTNNDEELGKEILYSSIYGDGHPYGSLNLGHSGDIANLTIDDVKQFYADYYSINNITVGLSGGYPDSFAAKLSNDLQVLPAGERALLEVPPAAMPDGRKAVIVEKETPAVAVSFGFPIALKRGDRDWIALWLARSYFGEHRSTNSHLFQRIREIRGIRRLCLHRIFSGWHVPLPSGYQPRSAAADFPGLDSAAAQQQRCALRDQGSCIRTRKAHRRGDERIGLRGDPAVSDQVRQPDNRRPVAATRLCDGQSVLRNRQIRQQIRQLCA